MFYSFEKDDALNILKKRNVANTDMSKFNCAGYAFGTYSWWQPSELRVGRIYSKKGRGLRFATKMVLAEIPNCRRIRNMKMAKADEYVVAMRLADDDFHFIRHDTEEVWSHKRGSEPRILTMTTEQVFSKEWSQSDSFNHYVGRIILFAVKRGI